MSDNILDIRNLSINYSTNYENIEVLKNIDVSLKRGDILAIVGESGCGKSTLLKSIIKLLPYNAVISCGEILFKNRNILELKEDEMRKIRLDDISMLLQNPANSFNPLMTVRKQLEEALKTKKLKKEELEKEYLQLLNDVCLTDVKDRMNMYPSYFSVGMLQRLALAIAISKHSKILLVDEPTTALDVGNKIQILNLLKDIRDKYNTSIIISTHDISSLVNIADSIVVIYDGKIVEKGAFNEVINNPIHTYTKLLIKSDYVLNKADFKKMYNTTLKKIGNNHYASI